MAGKTTRKRPRSFRNAPDFKLWTSGTAGDWEKRWEQAAGHAAARYARVMRDQVEVMIDKYTQSLTRRLILNAKRRRQRRGA